MQRVRRRGCRLGKGQKMKLFRPGTELFKGYQGYDPSQDIAIGDFMGMKIYSNETVKTGEIVLTYKGEIILRQRLPFGAEEGEDV